MGYVDCAPGESNESRYRRLNWAELCELRAQVESELESAWMDYSAGGKSRDRIEALLQIASDIDEHMEQRRAMARLVFGGDARVS